MTVHSLPIAPQTSTAPLEQYALHLLRMRSPHQPLDTILAEMEAIAADEQIPIIGPIEGAVLQSLVGLQAPRQRHILDIGTAIGYSALWLARDFGPNDHLWSIEIDPQRAARARTFIERAGMTARITILEGDVFDLLPNLDLTFSVIFQDVIKHVYFSADSTLALKLLDYCMAKLAPHGMLLGDNAFCLGEVLHSAAEVPPQVLGVQAYNRAVATHPALVSVIMPIRDGLWLSYHRPAPAIESTAGY